MQSTAVYCESGSFFARKMKNTPLILGKNGRGSVETEVFSNVWKSVVAVINHVQA